MAGATASGVVRFGGFFGNAVSEGAAFAIGITTAPTLAPILEDLKNRTWQAHPSKAVDAGTAAAIVAEDVELHDWGAKEAASHGFDGTRFDAILGEALNAPDLGTLYNLWRRGYVGDEDFRHGLRKAKLEDRWDDGLKRLKDARLAAAQIALAVVRSLLDSQGLLVGENDTTGGKVAPTPVSPIDALAEAAASGINEERLRVLINSVGLPMPLDAAAQSVFRGIIEKADFYLAVAQGDTRPAWADFIFDHARQIPSVADYVNAHIRGWIDADEMHKGAARHGMSAADADLLYLRTGRPAAPGQMATAAARGIDGPDGRPMDEPQFLKGIAESDIRPEWGPMLWESRYLYPPLFQITRLVQAGAITADTAAEWARKDRYPPEVVEPLHAYWSQPVAAGTDSWTKRAQTQFWTTTHRTFLDGLTPEPEARENLSVL